MGNNQGKNGDETMNATTLDMNNYADNYSLQQAIADVDAYVTGKLQAAHQNSFEMYLLEYPQLQEEVETALIARTGLQTLGKSQVLAANAGTELAGIESDGTGQKAPSFLQRLLGGLKPIPAFATAAILVLTITVGSVMFKAESNPVLAQLIPPGGNYQTVVLPNVRAGMLGNFQPLAVLDQNAEGGWMMLELELSFPEFTSYNVQIISWPGQSQQVALSSLRPDAKDNLSFALHASELPVGDYVARVVYDNGSREEVVANYAFSVEAGKGSNS